MEYANVVQHAPVVSPLRPYLKTWNVRTRVQRELAVFEVLAPDLEAAQRIAARARMSPALFLVQ